MEFRTKLGKSDIDFYTYPQVFLGIDKRTDIDDKSCTATVRWHAEVDYNSSGIDGIISVIDGVDIECEIEYYEWDDVECDDKKYKEFTVSSTDFKIIDEMEFNKDGLCPKDIQINFEDKTITVS